MRDRGASTHEGEATQISPEITAGPSAWLIRVLFEVSRAVTSPVERRQARLRAALNLVAAVLLFGVAGLTSLAAPEPIARGIGPVVATGALLASLAYGLSRTRHFRLATGLSIAVHIFIPTTLLLLIPESARPPLFHQSVWFVISILFAGTLARPRSTLLVGTLACTLATVVGLSRHAGPEQIIPTVTFLTNVAGLTFVLSRHRDLVERDRSAQLVARNAELLALKLSLEERVEARTSELKKSHDNLDLAYQALQKNQQSLLLSEKMASLGRLTAGIAHEMSSLIAAVRSALEETRGLVDEYQRSIADADVTDEDHRAIARDMGGAIQLAARAAERAAAFVRGMKSQTRDIGVHERVRFDAVSVIRDALQMLGHEVTTSRSRIDFRSAEERMEILGSPGKLAQVVTNLVTNAIDANAERGGGPVRVELERHEGELALTVADRGPGIAAEHLGRIFDPLFTTKPVGKGTGLGLTIVHDIVCGDFCGSIDVKSPPDGGALFAIHLPA